MSVVDISKLTFDNAQVVPAGEAGGFPVERNLDVVAAEINVIKSQTAQVIHRSIFEIGKRLCEAKALIGHGNWEMWLRDNVAYSETTARTLMRAYREMGGEQIDMLTGEAPADVFECLNLSQMVALFPLPVSERAAFVKEHDVKEMSVRDIEALVAEATEKGKQEAMDELQQERARADALEGALEKASDASKTWEKIANEQKKKWDEDKLKTESEVRGLKEKEQKLRDKIKALEEAPVQEKIVYVEKEAAPTAQEENHSEAQARVDALTVQLGEVQSKLEQAEQRAATLIQKADGRVQAVNFSIRLIAEQLEVIGDAIGQIKGGTTGDGELADKLSKSASSAIKAMLEGAEWYE